MSQSAFEPATGDGVASATPDGNHHGGGTSRPALWPAVRRAFRQPRFIVVAVVLGVSALGLNAATQFLQLHFRKLPVPLRVPSLSDEAKGIPATLGRAEQAEYPRWIQVSRDEPMEIATEEILGTKEHVDRAYVNLGEILRIQRSIDPRDSDLQAALWGDGQHARAPFESLRRSDPPATLVKFLGTLPSKPAKERNQVLGELGFVLPEAVIHMSAAYYTGLVDTVAHIPDRCYVADGFQPTNYDNVKSFQCGKFPNGKPRDIAFNFIHFDDQTGKGRASRYVGYIFHVNGQYATNPLEVRKELQNLFQKYGYYCKIELATGAIASPGAPPQAADARAEAAMKDFFAAALPEFETRLPDWQQVMAQK